MKDNGDQSKFEQENHRINKSYLLRIGGRNEGSEHSGQRNRMYRGVCQLSESTTPSQNKRRAHELEQGK